MKTGFYFGCAAIAVTVIFAADLTRAESLPTAEVENRGLYYESAQSEQVAAAAANQQSSQLNYNGYPGGIIYPPYRPPPYPLVPYPPVPYQYAPYSPYSNYQLSQQSSEAAAAAASRNRYSKLISDYGYGGLPRYRRSIGYLGYPAYPYRSSSLQQSSQSAAAAAAAARESSLSQSIQGGGIGPFGYPGIGSSQFYQQSSEAAAAAQASSQSLQIQQTGGYYPIPVPQPYPIPCPAPPAPICPRVECGYVRQCKTILEPFYPGPCCN